MIVDILDEMTAEITKLIVQLDHKKLVMPSSCNEGMKCVNARTLNDSFFMFFQHITAVQKSCLLLLVLESENRGFLAVQGPFWSRRKMFMLIQHA